MNFKSFLTLQAILDNTRRARAIRYSAEDMQARTTDFVTTITTFVSIVQTAGKFFIWQRRAKIYIMVEHFVTTIINNVQDPLDRKPCLF
jgi:uridine kinase